MHYTLSKYLEGTSNKPGLSLTIEMCNIGPLTRVGLCHLTGRHPGLHNFTTKVVRLGSHPLLRSQNGAG